MHIAVIGNTPVNGGVAVAADLALAGHDVTFSPWPGDDDVVSPAAPNGNITLGGSIEHALARRGGRAPVTMTSDLGEATADAALVVLDVGAPDFEHRFAELLPHLAQDQLVLVNMHGYWPSLRLAPLLRESGRQDITLCETMAPSHAANFADGVVQLQCVRTKVPVGIFPANRAAAAMPVLNDAFPTLVPTRNVLETGFAGLNMMIHFPLVLGNIGWCDRLEEKGEPVPLYLEGMTRHLSNLIEAQDKERSRVCDAYGTPWKSLASYLGDLYAATGETALEAVASSRYYRELPPYPAAAWRRWMSWDIPHAHVPLIALADLSGIEVPLHRAAVSLCSAFLQSDFAAEGVTIERLGLDGLSVTQVVEYVETGRREATRRRSEARALV